MNSNNNNNKRVLIVEDDTTSAFLMSVLAGKFFDVQIVNNGYDAIKALEKERFDIIFMDINLGDERMDGIRTMHTIRHSGKHKRTKIYALTAYSDAREWHIKQGFDDLILKPLTEEKIEEINKERENYVTGVSLFTKL